MMTNEKESQCYMHAPACLCLPTIMSVEVNQDEIACIDCHRRIQLLSPPNFHIDIFTGLRGAFCKVKHAIRQHDINREGIETVETHNLPLHLTGTATQACVLEFRCPRCHSAHRARQDREVAAALADAASAIHAEVSTAWVQMAPSERKFPWDGDNLLREMVRTGVPYLQSLRIVDGRETDVFDDNHRTGLFDPSIFETKGCMPASYSMTVKRDIEEGMSLLARYLRVTDFVNPIFAYRLSSADPELVSTQLTACMKELKEDYHVQIIRSGNDNSLLVAFVRQARFVNVGELLRQMEQGKVSGYLIPDHITAISTCLLRIDQSRRLIQNPTPISCLERRPNSLTVNVNCHRVRDDGLLGYVAEKPPRFFMVRPRSGNNIPALGPVIPMRFQTAAHAQTAFGNQLHYSVEVLEPSWRLNVKTRPA